MWKLVKDILFALLTYWREKEEQANQERQRRTADLQARDREIADEVGHERRETEEMVERGGRSPHAYQRAFERVRGRQQGG